MKDGEVCEVVRREKAVKGACGEKVPVWGGVAGTIPGSMISIGKWEVPCLVPSLSRLPWIL